MATEKISVSVDRDVLAELRKLRGPDVSLSAILNEALLIARSRYRMLDLLGEMEREKPATSADAARAEDLWRQAHG